LVQQVEVAPAAGNTGVNVPAQLIRLPHEAAQHLRVALAGEVDQNMIEVLPQRGRQQEELRSTEEVDARIVCRSRQHPQPRIMLGKSAVNQAAVNPAQVAHGIGVVEAGLDSQQLQALATRQAQVNKQGTLAGTLTEQRQVRSDKGRIRVGLIAEQQAELALLTARR